jgi:hypothetical protein
VEPKLGRPGDRTKVVCECCAAHPGHRCLSECLWPSHGRIELGRKIPTLNIESSVACSLNGDAGVLSHTSAVKLCSEILGPCTPYRWGVHGAGCTALSRALSEHRSPAEFGEPCARLRRRSTSSCHCLCASGEAASPGGLRSNSLAARSGPFGAGNDWATEARSTARCDATCAATLDGGRRVACGVDDATSSPKRRS